MMKSGIRWRDDTGWEFRCNDCAKSAQTTAYWPLYPPNLFWDRHKGMVRCKACWRIHERRRMAELYRTRPQHERRRDWQRAYYHRNIETVRAKKRAQYARRKARLAVAA